MRSIFSRPAIQTGSVCVLSALFLFLTACSAPKAPIAIEGFQYESSADSHLVAWHTTGQVGMESRVGLGFTSELAEDAQISQSVDATAWSLAPPAGGTLVWTNKRTLELQGSKLERNVKYTMTVKPGALKLPGDAGGYADFSFSFSIRPKLFSYETLGFTSNNPQVFDETSYSGALSLTDHASPEEIKSAITIKLDGKTLEPTWDLSSTLRPRFIVEGITKLDHAQDLVVFCSGPFFPSSSGTELHYPVPARQAFQLNAVQVVEQPDRHMRVEFSHPLQAGQDLRGLVSVEPTRELRFNQMGSVLEIFFPDGIGGVNTLILDQGIKNARGEKLGSTLRNDVDVKPSIPEVRFLSKGTIVPRKEGVTIPIETINLSAVIVSIERVYADRVGQFLQVNELDGEKELTRVSQPIWRKIVPIPYTIDRQNRWIRTALDLSPMIDEGDHNLYRVRLSFDVRHVEYPGHKPSDTELFAFPLEDLPLSAPSTTVRQPGRDFWDRYSSEHGRQRRDDDWYSQRENPWHPAFYQNYYYYEEDGNSVRYREKKRNFYLSDLGMIVQADASGQLSVAVSSLLDAKPVGGALLRVFNFQLQEIAQARTNSDGLAMIGNQKGEAFLVSAENGRDLGYLKLSEANAMPVSHYDVAGQEINQGVKGFLYAERGVWRPGNDIFLTFVLWDRFKILPEDHPVVLNFYDPSGKLMRTIRDVKPVGNFYQFKLATANDAPTGTWMVTVKIGSLSFSKAITVETIKPNRLKIALEFPTGITELGTKSIDAKLKVSWLHGAPAAESKYDINARFSSVPTVFPHFKGYVFDDPARKFKSEESEFAKGQLDEKGEATIGIALSASTISPGKLVANIKTRAYEPGGDFSTDVFAMPFSPYENYVGLQIPALSGYYNYLDADKSHPVKIALVDSEGKPLTGEVSIEVHKVRWRWWWDYYDGSYTDYLGTYEHERIFSKTVQVKAGSLEWNFQLPQRDWGRYYIRLIAPSGHATGAFFYSWWSDWHYPSNEDESKSVEMLSLSADKERYSVGDRAQIKIPSASSGRALITIENNGRILSSQWIETMEGQTIHELAVTQAMAPNVYLHVSLIQPHGQTANDRPIRLFGILPLMVENPASHLKPELACADSFEPESKTSVTVREASGLPMTYTLAVVDEGLLALTRFKTPNPWDSFFRREASALQTFDLYNQVANAFGGTIERLLAIGGSDDSDGDKGQKANRFPPMVRFYGPFELAKGGLNKHDLDIPQYIGAVRVMVVAGNDEAFGAAEKSVTVKKPLMVQASLPRVSAVTEEFNLPVNVFALEPNLGSVTVTVKTSGRLALVGSAKQKIQFTQIQDQMVNFKLKAADAIGLGIVEVVASNGKIEARQRVELDVQIPTAIQTKTTAFALAAGKSQSSREELVGMGGTNKVVLEVSRFEPLDLGRRLDYLIHYPYGCVEQTTSSVFPQLYLEQVLDLNPKQVAAVRTNIQAGIHRLSKFVTSTGGLGYWPGDPSPNIYGSTYAGHFLFEAERAGYSLPGQLKSGLVGYLKDAVNSMRSNSGDNKDYTQFYIAYALFDLALTGNPDLAGMNWLREAGHLSDTTRFKLAAAYALTGRKDDALKLIGGSVPAFSAYIRMSDDFGSDMRDYALVAEGLLQAGGLELALPIVQSLAKRLSSNDWYSTQSLSYALLAIGTYLKTSETGEKMSFSYDWAGQKIRVESERPIWQLELPLDEKLGARGFGLLNNSSVPLFVRLIKSGRPMMAHEDAQSEGLQLDVRYADEKGNYLDVENLPQGTDIIATVRVSTQMINHSLPNLALEFPVPSGWEITNTRFEGRQEEQSGFDYQDIRDDRILTFFSLYGTTSKTFTFRLHASYCGKFYLPGASVAAMYDASINANDSGRWVVVDAAKTAP